MTAARRSGRRREIMFATKTQGNAMITGTLAGIGKVYANRLAKRGYDLILVARSKDRLEKLARRLASETGRLVETIVADLARVETAPRTDAGITMLVNDAGIAAVRPLHASNVETMDEMIRLNVLALTRLVYAAVPSFVARG